MMFYLHVKRWNLENKGLPINIGTARLMLNMVLKGMVPSLQTEQRWFDYE